MTTEVSTKVVKIDFKMIIGNALNKEYWGRKWKIFEYDGYHATIELENILVMDQRINLRVTMVNKELGRYDYEWIRLPMDQYNENVFRKKLLSEMHTIVHGFERWFAREKPKHKILVEERTKAIEGYRKKLSEHLDNLKITDEDVRRVYINRKVNEENFNEDINNYIMNHMDHELRHIHHMIDAMVQFVDREE